LVTTRIIIPEDRRVVSTVVDSPVGPLTLFARDEGLSGLLFASTKLADETITRRAVQAFDHPVLRKTVRQLEEYFNNGRETFDVPLSLEGTAFQMAVWRELMNVAYGTTISYGGLAARLGSPRKARAVGGAVGRNPVGILVPCHRVIGANGGLTGFGGGLAVKAALFELEGADSRPAYL
jgi:methylated-DNA-[protein]-cysteine S-methyltransferase